ncbi:MAG: bifunctional methylenetetrahydrofolate dehydrogenase/methenyltetrahydrofolate cyclohydrolase FolD [Acidobacteriota bacterium]|nr:bifunctional methylenetetrahydrofolate dehydrogenase/methenyltetrahydrofolate cyclohydrolase FolD [Acidobacteriota bacterium]
MSRILDGRKIAKQIRAEVAAETLTLTGDGHRRPGLAVIRVGEDPASKIYVGTKTRAAEEAGFHHLAVEMPANSGPGEIRNQIDALNADDEIDGILLQLPLPAPLDATPLIERIDPEKDVDGLHSTNTGRLWLDREGLAPATPSGIIELLNRSKIEVSGRRAVVVGRSALVGKPMAGLLLRQHATVTVCHSRTRDLEGVCREADLLIAAVGRLAMIGPDHVRDGAVVVDVGIHRVTEASEVERLFPGNEKRRAGFEKRGSIVTGDVDYTRVAPKASAITPVPGGVGPLTVAALLANTLEACRRRSGLET